MRDRDQRASSPPLTPSGAKRGASRIERTKEKSFRRTDSSRDGYQTGDAITRQRKAKNGAAASRISTSPVRSMYRSQNRRNIVSKDPSSRPVACRDANR